MGTKRVIRHRVVTEEDRLAALLDRTSKHLGDLFTSAGGAREEVVVGLDASLTSYGISVYAPNSGRHATLLFKPKFRGAQRLEEIYDFIQQVAEYLGRNFEVREYVMEAYAMGIRGGQVFSIGEGGGVTKLALVKWYGSDEAVAYPTLVSTSALKKFVTGKGVGKKNEILLAVYRKWGVDFGGQDDMADAFGLARVGSALLSGTTEHLYEQEVVNNLERNTEWAPRS